MKKLIVIPVLAFISITGLFLLQNCQSESSSDVNQDRIYCWYELFYNANEDKTYARAQFRFGNMTGTLLQLADGSEVYFNNQLLTFKPALAYYERDFAGLIPSGTFKWIDANGNVFENTVELRSIGIPANVDTIPRHAAYELFWIGDSLKQYETVILTANGENEGDAQICTQSNLHSKSIIIPLNQLQAIGHGPGTIWLERVYAPPLQQKTSAGGAISSKYRATKKTVYFD